MWMRISDFKPAVAALLIGVMISIPRQAPAQDVDALLDQLAQAEDAAAARRLENQVMEAWGQSGSPAMDMLMRRGEAALEVRDWRLAAEHFRAITDHAPEFAEGWHGLALAYFNLERFGPAMLALERVLALNPRHFAALRGVGAIHERVENPALAYRAYQQVLQMRPHDSEVEGALDRLDLRVRGTAL